LLPREQVCDKSRLSVNLWGGQCGLGVRKQASFVYCLAIRHSAGGKIKSILQAQQVTTHRADTLAILGFAVDAIGVKN